jgi:hypothetical protein
VRRKDIDFIKELDSRIKLRRDKVLSEMESGVNFDQYKYLTGYLRATKDFSAIVQEITVEINKEY